MAPAQSAPHRPAVVPYDRTSVVDRETELLIDPRLAQAFVAVADAGSFVAAAQRLHIGQSGLSQQIKRLEATVGQPLFERTSRSVEITEMGRRLYPVAQDLLAAAERFADAARAETHQIVLRVAIAENGVNPIAVGLLTAIRADLLDVDLEIVRTSLLDQHDALRGDIDAVIGRPPYDGELPNGVERTPVARDRLVVVAPSDDPLLASRWITEGDLAGRTRLVHQSVPVSWGGVSPLLTNSAANRLAIPVDSYRTACAQIAVSRHVSVMPESFARSYQLPGVGMAPLVGSPIMTVELVTRAEHRRDVVRRLVDRASAAAADLGDEREQPEDGAST